MKVLLDNCVPRPFERLLQGHEVIHCSRLGWERLTNGKLLAAAEETNFSVVVTVDQGIQHQQTMRGRKVAVIYLRVPKNDMLNLAPMAIRVLEALEDAQPGGIDTIEHPDYQK